MLDLAVGGKGMTDEPIIRKDMAVLTDDYFKTPKTSLLQFHFEPHPFVDTEQRLKTANTQHYDVEGKEVYTFDSFFNAQESQEMRHYSNTTGFSRRIYAKEASRNKGEEPARSMDNKEKWEFFAHPPQAVKEIYKLLSLFAYQLDADIATLPWELCSTTTGAPAVATNRIENLSEESMQMGKHRDYDTEEGVSFGLPILYPQKNEEISFYENSFVNGAIGKPWLVSLMFYTTEENFSPQYGLGTAFYKDDGTLALRTDTQHMRMILFEGNLIHGIEASKLPEGIKTSRVSYVFKLSMNPRKPNVSLKTAFRNLILSKGK